MNTSVVTMDISKENQQDSKDGGTDSTSAAEAGFARIKITDDMFVGWSLPNDQPNEKKAKGVPRLSHKKSKTGCQRCRTRRVKCDEGKPVCGGCSRHHVTCIYDPAKPEKQADESEVSSQASSRSARSKISHLNSSTNAPSESKGRRILELRLMHQWTLNTCLTFPLSADPETRSINTTIIPTMALKDDALLYCIFFLSALHLMKIDPTDLEAKEIYLHYYSLTITAHRGDVNALGRLNADVVCLTAALIRLSSFAILQERSIPPYGYKPPSQWMSMNHGTTAIHRESWKWVGTDPNSVAYRSVVRKLPNLTDFASLFAPTNRKHLLHLIGPVVGCTESWTPEIEEAYGKTLSFIGAIQLALDAGIEGPPEILRRCVAFPGHIPKLFFEMVEERRPRALVVLAHYFAYLARFRENWWIGHAGMREVRAIAGVLGPEWGDFMSWPLGEVERVYI